MSCVIVWVNWNTPEQTALSENSTPYQQPNPSWAPLERLKQGCASPSPGHLLQWGLFLYAAEQRFHRPPRSNNTLCKENRHIYPKALGQHSRFFIQADNYIPY